MAIGEASRRQFQKCDYNERDVYVMGVQTFLDISIAVMGRPGMMSNMSSKADPGMPSSLCHWTTLYTLPSSVEKRHIGYRLVFDWKKKTMINNEIDHVREFTTFRVQHTFSKREPFILT